MYIYIYVYIYIYICRFPPYHRPVEGAVVDTPIGLGVPGSDPLVLPVGVPGSDPLVLPVGVPGSDPLVLPVGVPGSDPLLNPLSGLDLGVPGSDPLFPTARGGSSFNPEESDEQGIFTRASSGQYKISYITSLLAIKHNNFLQINIMIYFYMIHDWI
jgi:hypothetical protein